MNDSDLKYNGERYSDPTPYKALTNIEVERLRQAEQDKHRFLRLRGCLLRVCEIAGFKFEGPLILKDLRTGRIWRG